MGKLLLSETQIRDFIEANKYKVDEATEFISRCIDGRYPNGEGLPALATPGADVGTIAALFATANTFGFQIDLQKTWDILVEIVGGVKNLRFHTDDHAEKGILMGGCGHMKSIINTPDEFGLTPEQADFIVKHAEVAKANGAQEVVLRGEHQEGAVVLVKGPYGIYPQSNDEAGKRNIQIFEFHQGLVDKRNRALSKKLIDAKAVQLFEGQDEEYLYEVLSSTTEDHLLLIAGKLAKELPIYAVSFDEKGNFTLEEAGKVE